MDKHALHPYFQQIMGNVAPPAAGTGDLSQGEPEVPPDDELPQGIAPDQAMPSGPPDMGAQGPQEPQQGAPVAGGAPGMPDLGGPDLAGLQPDMAAALGGGQMGMEEGPVAGPTPGVPDPADPLRVSKDEGLYAVNELQIIEILQKILSGKYALMVMYLHYGATLLAHWRDGVHEHFQEHAKEEQLSAYYLAKKIVAMGGQATPKVGTVRPVATFADMGLELLKAEQKVLRLWSELNLAAGQNLGLQSLAQDGALLDQQHADDIRRYMRSME